MALKPLSNHVIVKPITDEEVTKAGIILPETVDKEKPEKGEVIAVGPGKQLENGQRLTLDVNVGDKIVFTKYGPHEVKIGQDEYLIVSENDILAVIE